MNRNTMSYTNLSINQGQLGTKANLTASNFARNGLNSRKVLEKVGNESEEDEVIDFDVWKRRDSILIFLLYFFIIYHFDFDEHSNNWI